jgi:hypothetical protein
MRSIILISIYLILQSCGFRENGLSSNTHSDSYEDQGKSVVVVAKRALIRKVIYDVNYIFDTDRIDSSINKIKQFCKISDGYIVNSNKNSIRIRIPSTKLNTVLNSIESVGKLVDKSIKGQDVTEEYNDLEIRIDNILKARKRYLALLEKAENVEAALRVEKELERLERELNLLKGREKRLSHLVQYTTVSIEFRNEIKPGPIGYIFIGFYEGLKWLFVW